jgi:hypothetical protein
LETHLRNHRLCLGGRVSLGKMTFFNERLQLGHLLLALSLTHGAVLFAPCILLTCSVAIPDGPTPGATFRLVRYHSTRGESADLVRPRDFSTQAQPLAQGWLCTTHSSKGARRVKTKEPKNESRASISNNPQQKGIQHHKAIWVHVRKAAQGCATSANSRGRLAARHGHGGTGARGTGARAHMEFLFFWFCLLTLFLPLHRKSATGTDFS